MESKGDNNMTSETETRHGGAHDRGSADAWYQRPRTPHLFRGDSYSTPRVSEAEMTLDEVAAYHRGYDEGTPSEMHKEWGG